MKKAMLSVVLLGLCICLSACNPMQPNTGTVKNAIEPKGQLESSFSTAGESTSSSSDITETNYIGIGLVGYKVLSMDFVDDLNEAGISMDKLLDQATLESEERLILVKFTLTNISVPSPSTEASEYLTNVFSFRTEEEKLKSINRAEKSAPGPQEELSRTGDPIYFNKTSGDTKRYFELPLPAIGDETEFILGWKADESVIEDIKNGTLQLTYTMMGPQYYVSFPYIAGEDA